MTVDDRYELLGVLAEGGMSRIWRARELDSEREVALKLPRDEFKQDEAMLERFRRECRALLDLQHPNLVTALATGEADGLPYLAMERVEGEDLRARLHRGPLSIHQAVDVARQVLAALDYAHGRGLVHRDIAARNVLLDPHGHVKVVDFGIARCVDEKTLTKTGQMLGSVSYMAPEQALGETPQHAVDIYSVGVLLYEMLTGELPFTSDNPVQLALKHVHKPAPRLPDRFGPELQAIVGRALAKQPEERFLSAREMQAALARLALDRTRVMQAVDMTDVTLIRPAVAHPRTGPRWWHLIAAAVVPLVVAVPLLVRQPAAREVKPSAEVKTLQTVVVKPPASPSPFPDSVTASTPPDTPIQVVEMQRTPSPPAVATRQATPEATPVAARPVPTPRPAAQPTALPTPDYPQTETRAMMEEPAAAEEDPAAPAAPVPEEDPAAPAAPVVAPPAPEPIPSLLVLPPEKRLQGN